MSAEVRLEVPIVLLRTSETPFVDYLAEVLNTEGLPWFEIVASWSEAARFVGKAGVLLMPHGCDVDIGAAWAWLDAGGGIAAIRPQPQLAELAGLRALGRTARELPLVLEAPFDFGAARAHGEIDLYELNAAGETMEHAYVRCDGVRYPAVVSTACRRGRLVVFAYDLPRSIALTRQGNPDWTGARGTDFGSNTFRPVDLFVRGGGAKTWLDFPSAGVPSADLQQRLLADLVALLSPAPLPRVWYLPDACQTVLSVVADSDGAEPEIVAEELDDIAAAGGCMSAFLIDRTVDGADGATVARWRAAGHEVSVHPDYGLHGDKSKPNRETMLCTQREILARFRRRFGFAPRTVRNHSAAWIGFTEQVGIERSLGIRLDSAYVYSSAFSKPPFNGPVAGYVNGSGQPQKFADERGRVLDIYQLGAQGNDEALKPRYLGYDTAAAWQVTQRLMDESIQRWHSYIVLSFHPITYHSNPDAKRWLRDMILPYAREHGVPVWSTEKILDFADARRACGLADLRWDGRQLKFVFHAPRNFDSITLAIPTDSHGSTLARIVSDGIGPPGPTVRIGDRSFRLGVLQREAISAVVS